MNHLTKRHLVLIIPVLAILMSPFMPFAHEYKEFLGMPALMSWVAFWAIATTAILSWLFRHEEELGESPDFGMEEAA